MSFNFDYILRDTLYHINRERSLASENFSKGICALLLAILVSLFQWAIGSLGAWHYGAAFTAIVVIYIVFQSTVISRFDVLWANCTHSALVYGYAVEIDGSGTAREQFRLVSRAPPPRGKRM